MNYQTQYGMTNPGNSGVSDDMMQGLFRDLDFDFNLDDLSFGSAEGWDTASSILGGVGAIGQGIVGYKQMGLLEDQIALQEEAFREKQAELNRNRQARTQLNASYAG